MSIATTPKASFQDSLTVSTKDIRWLVWNALIVAVYWAVLSYVYIHSVSVINASNTSLYLRPNLAKEIEGMIWAALMLPAVNSEWEKPSDFGLTLLYFFGLIPALIIFGLADQARSSMYTMIAGCMAVFLVCKAPLHIPLIRFRQAGKAGMVVAAIGVLFIVAWFTVRGNARNLNVNLLAVYDYRDAAGSVFDAGPIAYLAAWMPRVLNPFLLCYSLQKRNWALFAVSFAVQLFCLVIYQEKSVLLPCAILPMFCLARSGRQARIFFILFLIATIIVCEIVYEYFDFNLLVQLWTRRFFFTQQFLYFNYFDVFKKIGLVFYSDSFLSRFIHYPFPYPPAFMVAYYTNGVTDSDPNTGFLGAGYMELGNIGVIVNGVFAGLVLKIFDRMAPAGMPMWFFGTAAFLPFMAMLITQNFLTSILTGGVAMLALLILLTRLRPDPAPRALPA